MLDGIETAWSTQTVEFKNKNTKPGKQKIFYNNSMLDLRTNKYTQHSLGQNDKVGK